MGIYFFLSSTRRKGGFLRATVDFAAAIYSRVMYKVACFRNADRKVVKIV